jgi:hypothetical protein
MRDGFSDGDISRVGAMSRLLLALITAVMFSFPCLSQSSEKPLKNSKSSRGQHLQLTAVETIKIASEPAEGFTTAEPLRCDVDGNLYLRVQVDVEPAIRRFNAEGRQEALFRPSLISDLNVDFATYFSVRQDGEIDQLVFPSRSEDRYVVTFKSDGTYKSKAKLQPGFSFRPYMLATFPSGEWLVTGVRNDDDPNVHVKWPFTGIFSQDGTLLKLVVLQGDEKIHKMAAASDPAVVPEGRHYGNTTIEMGAAAAAGDGNVYVMRRLSPAIVYAISPSGEVVRRFRVDPGNSDFHPASMQIAGNRMAVLFFKSHSQDVILPEDVILKVVDLEGHELVTYDHVGKSQMGIALVCYSPVREKFTFLTTTTDNFLGFSIAEPR